MNAPVAGMMMFGKDSISTTCPNCRNSIRTRTELESTTTTHLVALLLCLCFCPLVCCPYINDCFKATQHYCPQCGAMIGSFRE